MAQSVEELYAALEAARDRQTQIDIEVRAAQDAWVKAAAEEKLAGFTEAGGVVGETRVRKILATLSRPDAPTVRLDEGPFVVIGVVKLEYADAIVFHLSPVSQSGRPGRVGTHWSRLIAILPEDQPKGH